jgi:hypothetical protein
MPSTPPEGGNAMDPADSDRSQSPTRPSGVADPWTEGGDQLRYSFDRDTINGRNKPTSGAVVDRCHHSSHGLQHLRVLARLILVGGRQTKLDSFRCRIAIIEEQR